MSEVTNAKCIHINQDMGSNYVVLSHEAKEGKYLCCIFTWSNRRELNPLYFHKEIGNGYRISFLLNIHTRKTIEQKITLLHMFY